MNGDQPGANPERRAGREPRRPGMRAVAANDQRMAAAVLVIGGGRAGQQSPPERRRVLVHPKRQRIDRRRRNADVGDHHVTGMLAPRQQQVAVLAPAEGHGHRRPEGTAEGFAGVAMDTARNIDRNAAKIALGTGLGEFQCHAL